MVYLAKKNGQVIYHANKDEMFKMDGVKPEMEITDEDFEKAGGLVRIINNKIFLGKTDKEKTLDEAQKEIEKIDEQLKNLDNEYLTPRVLAGAAKNGEYELAQITKHTELAEPLRVQRKTHSDLIKNAK